MDDNPYSLNNNNNLPCKSENHTFLAKDPSFTLVAAYLLTSMILKRLDLNLLHILLSFKNHHVEIYTSNPKKKSLKF